MNNQAVINFLNQVRKILLDDKSWLESTIQPINEAFDKAISALQEQEAKRLIESSLTQKPLDTISRTTAIDALKGLPTWWADEGGYYGGAQPPMVALLDPEDAVSAIENLPSAQPEIVRCKDCKYGEQDEVGRWFCRSLGCQIGDEDGSGFCADGERRADA